MEVFAGIGLVSMVENNVKVGVHKHMVIVVDNHKKCHHNHWIGMHHGLNYAHNMPKEVVVMKIVHRIETPPTFDFSILDVYHH
ncbi:hypothetical protein AHAS_Ahas20G0168600 [Arachis hypogaea]